MNAILQAVSNMLAFSLGSFLEKLGEGVINAVLLLLQLIARGLLHLELSMSKDLVLKTPAIGPHWFDSPFVLDVPGISGPEGIIHRFYTQTFNLVLLFAGAGLLLSAIMLVAGWMPTWRAAAKENLLRTPLFLVLAFMGPWILQFFIDVNTLLVGIGFADEATYTDLRDSLWDNLLDPRDPGDSFGQLIGLLVASLALLVVMLELAARYGVIIFIGAISPLVLMGLAFNFTRGFATKALRLFIGAVFLQGFAAIALRLTLEIVVAYGSGGGIATWALLSGMAVTIATLPKVLSGASEAVGGGSKLLKGGVGLAVAGAAVAARSHSNGAKRSASPTPSPAGSPSGATAGAARTHARTATFSRSIADSPSTAPRPRQRALVRPPADYAMPSRQPAGPADLAGPRTASRAGPKPTAAKPRDAEPSGLAQPGLPATPPSKPGPRPESRPALQPRKGEARPKRQEQGDPPERRPTFLDEVNAGEHQGKAPPPAPREEPEQFEEERASE